MVTDLVYDKASSWYGKNLPFNIEERIAKELYGDIVYTYWHEKLQKENPDISDEELTKETFKNLHETIITGYDKVNEIVTEYVENHWSEDDGEKSDVAI